MISRRLSCRLGAGAESNLISISQSNFRLGSWFCTLISIFRRLTTIPHGVLESECTHEVPHHYCREEESQEGTDQGSSLRRHSTQVCLVRTSCLRDAYRQPHREFLTGFHKRKLEKKEQAKKKAQEREKQDRLEARREVCLGMIFPCTTGSHTSTLSAPAYACRTGQEERCGHREGVWGHRW